MAEQQHNDGQTDDVSMDEILTSLRNILEEEDAEPEADSGRSGAVQGDTGEERNDDPAGDHGEDELVLTDVVETEPDPAEQRSADKSGAVDESGSEGESGLEFDVPGLTPEDSGPDDSAGNDFDALFGRWEREESDEGTEPAADWAPSFQPDPAPAAEPENEPGFPGDTPLGGGPAVDGAGPETSPGPAASAPAEPAPSETGQAAPAPDIDRQALDQAVTETVEQQVAQATADLDSRLAEALEPKIREVLQGYLEERLPDLLREIAEAEIERIKKGE